MPEIIYRDTSQPLACQHEKAVALPQDIQEPPLLVAGGSPGKRHAQVHPRLLFTRFECDHHQAAARQHLVKLLSQQQGRALHGFAELVSPDQVASTRIQPQEVVVTGIDDQDRGIARDRLGCKGSRQPDTALPQRCTCRGVESIRHTLGPRIRNRLSRRSSRGPVRRRSQDQAGWRPQGLWPRCRRRGFVCLIDLDRAANQLVRLGHALYDLAVRGQIGVPLDQ